MRYYISGQIANNHTYIADFEIAERIAKNDITKLNNGRYARRSEE